MDCVCACALWRLRRGGCWHATLAHALVPSACYAEHGHSFGALSWELWSWHEAVSPLLEPRL
eukprot:scaffold183319_cov20-Tisochrysis_lutea.AAC.3